MVLDALDLQAWESRSIQTLIHGQQPIAMRCGVSSDQEIGENPPRAQITMPSPPFHVASEGPSGSSPNIFVQFPINRNSRVFEERIHEIFSSTWASYQFGENW